MGITGHNNDSTNHDDEADDVLESIYHHYHPVADCRSGQLILDFFERVFNDPAILLPET